MGRRNGVLQALLLQSDVDSWLEDRDNPAPMLRRAAAFWRSLETDRANARAWVADRHAQLWDKAYRLEAARPWTQKAGAKLAATFAELKRMIKAQPQLHPAAIERALASEPVG